MPYRARGRGTSGGGPVSPFGSARIFCGSPLAYAPTPPPRAARTDNALSSRVPTQVGPTNGLTRSHHHQVTLPPIPHRYRHRHQVAPPVRIPPAQLAKSKWEMQRLYSTSSNPKQTRELLHSTSGVQRPTNTTVESPFYSASRIFTPRTGDLNLNEPCNWGPPDSETT